MPNSPFIFGPNGALNLQQGPLQLQTNHFLANDGPKNYIPNNVFETGDTTGWVLGTATLASGTLYPQGTPSFGSGASGSLSISALTANAVSGNYSLNYISSAATTAGNFVASQFTIDPSDQGKVLSIQFNYKLLSGSNINFTGTSANSFGVAIWDVANSIWIVPNNNFGLVQFSLVGILNASFQTNSNSTTMYLCVYNVNATPGAVTMIFDNFMVGPQQLTNAPIIVQLPNYTPTITAVTSNPTKGTTTQDFASVTRIGNMLSIQYTYIQTAAGGAGSGTYLWSLPAGLAIDTSAITPNIQTVPSVVGQAATFDGSTTRDAYVKVYDSTHLALALEGSGTAPAYISSATNPLNTTSMQYTFSAMVPIAGWSTNVISSPQFSQIPVASEMNTLASTTSTANTAIAFTASPIDTFAANTIASGRFIAPLTGYYRISGTVPGYSTGGGTAYAIINGGNTLNNSNVLTGFSTTSPVSGSIIAKLNAGDSVQLGTNTSGTWASVNFAALCVDMIPGMPGLVAQPDSVNARYHGSAGAAISGNTAVIQTTKDFDTSGAYNTSTGVYTIPSTGKYQINVGIVLLGTFALNSTTILTILKNATAVSAYNDISGGAITANSVLLSDTINFNAGDAVTVQVSCTATSPTIYNGLPNNSFFSIARVGN